MTSGFIASFVRIYSILLVSILVLADDQAVLSGKAVPKPRTTGVLRRFTLDDGNHRDHIMRSVSENGLDVWQLADSHVDIYVPSYSADLPSELTDIPHTLSIITESEIRPNSSAPPDWVIESFTDSTYHKDYHPLYEIDAFIQGLAELHPDLIKLHNIGHSAEGREMLAITVSAPTSDSAPRRQPRSGKLGIVIVGAQHAREWIATATSTYLTHALVANASEPHSLRYLLETFDFHIIPAPNPDGYSYTWEVDRYWYKNRQVLGPHTKCMGVDMNRNWGFKWKSTVGDVPMVAASSKLRPTLPADPCSHWYPGHRPFEAPEVNNIANFVTTLPNLVGFLDLRSYGQMLSAPFSYTCKRWPKDAEDLIEAATGATQALKSVHGTYYETGILCNLLYPAPGNIVDWMYKIMGIKFSYVVHLRDTGTYGFSLPPRWIKPVGEETAKMVEYLGKFIPTRVRGRA
ncbi:peptidase M14 [Macrolepiota fuliginosa MF-IS2]|uniref:Peptidase M14 n=1 Tax=Macrolepiota fuliginosa MF-IS2 TaxID=1400762 RepID=A0A9P5X324_9AGAR|nr:peptidase M14 [Macrolepiota fuliginosa MF-IS2]